MLHAPGAGLQLSCSRLRPLATRSARPSAASRSAMSRWAHAGRALVVVAMEITLPVLARKVQIPGRAETTADVLTHRTAMGNVTRPNLDRVTLCYFRFGILFPG